MSRRVPQTLTALAIAASTLALAPAPASAAPKTAKVHLQVPVKISDPASTDLDQIESYGTMPLWRKSFEIPYDDLETKIAKELKSQLAKHIPQGKQTETCSDPCPDVTWWVNYDSSFKFTKRGDIKLNKIGPSGDNRIRASIKLRARVGITGTIHASAMVPTQMPVGIIPVRKEVDAPVDLFVELEMTASVDATLWPDLAADDIEFNFKKIASAPNIELNDVGVELGAELGVLIGASPLGLVSGGPLVFSSLLAVIGDTAADVAESKIEARMDAAISKEFNGSLGKVEKAAKDALKTAIAKANTKKNSVLNAKLPGVNKSIKQLESALGADIKLHTVTPANTIGLSAVLRMNPKAGSAALAGEVQIPSGKCVYAEFMGGAVPGGYEPINTNLESKIGQSCSTVMAGLGVDPAAYLGANPRTALGNTAQKLPTWKSGMGDVSFTGTLEKSGRHYACGVAIGGMPNTAIMELRLAAGSTGWDVRDPSPRVLVQKVGGSTVVLDDRLKPTGDVKLGGEYNCNLGGGGPRFTPSRMKELRDLLDGCPGCGTRIERGGSLVYQFKDVATVNNSAAGKAMIATVKKHGKKLGGAKASVRSRSRVRGRSIRRGTATRGVTKTGKGVTKSSATKRGMTKKGVTNKGITNSGAKSKSAGQ